MLTQLIARRNWLVGQTQVPAQPTFAASHHLSSRMCLVLWNLSQQSASCQSSFFRVNRARYRRTSCGSNFSPKFTFRTSSVVRGLWFAHLLRTFRLFLARGAIWRQQRCRFHLWVDLEHPWTLSWALLLAARLVVQVTWLREQGVLLVATSFSL